MLTKNMHDVIYLFIIDIYEEASCREYNLRLQRNNEIYSLEKMERWSLI